MADVTLTLKTGPTDVEVTLSEDGSPKDLTGATVTLDIGKGPRVGSTRIVEIIGTIDPTPATGKVKFPFDVADLDAMSVGGFNCQPVVDIGGVVQKFQVFSVEVVPGVHNV